MCDKCLKQLGKVTLAAVIFEVFFFLIIFCSMSHACSRDIGELKPELQAKYNTLKERANAEGINFKAICTYRSQAEQDALYAQGRTSPGRKVTWTKRSNHTSREAVDVVVLDASGKLDWSAESYLRIGAIAKDIGLVWGGDWKVRDYGHFGL